MDIVNETEVEVLSNKLYNDSEKSPILSAALNVLIFAVCGKKKIMFDEITENIANVNLSFKNNCVQIRRCLISKGLDECKEIDENNYFIPLRKTEERSLPMLEVVEFDSDYVYVKPNNPKNINNNNFDLIGKLYYYILKNHFSVADNLDMLVLSLDVLSVPYKNVSESQYDILNNIYEQLSIIIGNKQSLYLDFPCVNIFEENNKLTTIESRIIYNVYIGFYNSLDIESRKEFKSYFNKSRIPQLIA